MYLELLLLFFASYVFIFVKAFQQRNVMGLHYPWVLPSSIVMAFVEVYVIAMVAAKGYGLAIVLSVGLGAGLGALSSMWIHQKYVSNGSKEQTNGG